MENGEQYLSSHLAERWDLFLSLTFKSVRRFERAWRVNWFRLIRTAAKVWGVPFSSLLWVVRVERGGIGGRPHLHAVLGCLPAWVNVPYTGLILRQLWSPTKRLNSGELVLAENAVGWSDIRPYDRSLGAAVYTLKDLEGLSSSSPNVHREQYEDLRMCRQGADMVMFSNSALRVLRVLRTMRKTSSGTAKRA